MKRSRQAKTGSNRPDSNSSLQSLPRVLQQVIMCWAGRGGHGAFASCKALRAAFNTAVHSPDMLSRYCLSAWGPKDAVEQALEVASDIFKSLPKQEYEQKLLGLLHGLAEKGATFHGYNIMDAIQTGGVSVLDEVLQLLDLPSKKPESGLSMHVAACCSGLVNCTHWPEFNAEMVRLLVRAITVTAGVSIHFSTFEAALRVAACDGRSSIVSALLEAAPPQECISTALHYALKTSHGDVVKKLFAAGGTIDEFSAWPAFCGAHQTVVRQVVEAMRRSGAWNRDMAVKAVNLLLGTDDSRHLDQGLVLYRRAATLRMLVSEFNADPAAHGSSSLAVASAREGPVGLLAELLLLMGADADEALLTLCNSEAQNRDLLGWYQYKRAEGVTGLLAIGSESPMGASRAVTAALEHGRMAPARLLLESGAVTTAACEGLLLRALGTAAAAPQGGHGGANAGDEQGDLAAADVGNPVAAMNGQRRWGWAWELARSGTLRQSTVERALEDACRRGDAEAVQELASMGLAGLESCTAAFWLAFEGGHVDCMQRLHALDTLLRQVETESASKKGPKTNTEAR
ncbi:hypothetical protein Vafri_130 [Volvox africanus]|nr:hypothetical protein Vafri_130 [Volvox africanus]